MPAYDPPLQPVALTDQILNLQPDDGFRRVDSVEPMAQVGPVDFGSAAAGGTATDSSGSSEIEVTELEMTQHQVGQFRIVPISDVEIELRQDGRQEQRMTNANTASQWTPHTPANLREFYVWTDDVPYLVVTNPNTYAMDATRVAFHGFKYNLTAEEIPESQVDGQPISIPVDKLEGTTQSRSSSQASGVQRRRVGQGGR